MAPEMFKYIENFEKFSKEIRKVDVIVSYDCSDKDDPFGDQLRNLIVSSYAGELITKSNYRLGKRLSFSELDILDKQIKKMFSDIGGLKESSRKKETVVVIIISDGKSLQTHISIKDILGE